MSTMSTGGRRSHRKSRNGCANCKARKVKCDEAQPACGNCMRHGVECAYSSLLLDRHSQSPSAVDKQSTPEYSTIPPDNIMTDSSSSPEAQPSPHININILHIELMHTYATASCFTLSRNPALQSVWGVQIPRIGMEFDYVMCAIMAFSSLHMAYFKPEKKELYTSQAVHLHGAAMRSVNAVLPNVTNENCAALWSFAVLNCAFSCARPRGPGDFLFMDENGLADWLLVFRGIRVILDSTYGRLFNTSLAPILATGRCRELARETKSHNIHSDLGDLLRLISETVLDPGMRGIYIREIEELSKSFYMKQEADSSRHESESTDVFIWLFRVSGEYLNLLSKRTPESLTIFAYFCTLIKDLEWAWWMNGWSFHLISVIYHLLDHNYRAWLQWPIAQLGWLPP
ncbi:hypothetical protein BKA64DRAFT_686947 [Cadophora sp. MPI-SDFR-AT-0126]|nr:hypothetical protein BKA64DRAFT_686947 [Leotiomycetes sp. MPI-SDFR-AT-0126]